MTRNLIRTNTRLHPIIRRVHLALAGGVVGLLAVAGLAVSPALGATVTTGIFPDTLRPSVAADPDRGQVELGIRFSPDQPGSVTALKYYQSDKATGVDKATLWSSDGSVLAQASFTPSTTVGWRTVPLKTAVKLTAGKTYVASYNAPRGGYPVSERNLTTAKTQNGFTLTPGAGVYRYGPTEKIPTSTFDGSNYLVDIVYTPTAAASTPTTTPSPTPTPTTSPAPTPTTAPSPTPKPTSTAFPTASTTGLPAGWTPRQVVTGDYWVRTPGQVVEDLKITNGAIYVAAPNVTLRRVQGVNAYVRNGYAAACQPNLTVEDSEFTPAAVTTDRDEPVIGHGGFTLKNVKIDGAPEGVRVGGSGIGCGPVIVERSFIRVVSPTVCTDWHGDGIQGYEGAALTVRQSTVLMEVKNNCWGTAPFFYPSGQGNTSVDVDGLLVGGGGYSFRDGMPSTVKNLNVVDGSWAFGPVDVACSQVRAWDAKVVKLDASGKVASTVRSATCTGEGN